MNRVQEQKQDIGVVESGKYIQNKGYNDKRIENGRTKR
jgi:hypothetical protein